MAIHRCNLVKILFFTTLGLFMFTQMALADRFTGLETEPGVLALADTEEPSQALELKRLYLDTETITKGYTVETAAGDFRVGVVDRAVTVPVEVILKQIPATHLLNSKTEEKLSKIFEFDIRKRKAQSAKRKAKEDFNISLTESLGVLEKPIYVALRYNANSLYKKVVHFWNKPTQEWLPLPSTRDFDNNLARAIIHLPFARLAVFDDPDVYEGLASWYAYKDCHCAAATIYLKGSRLKVTNISGSPRHGRSLIVRVNDYGPNPAIHPDRVIDLDKHAYLHLAASLGSGLMRVRVERVE